MWKISVRRKRLTGDIRVLRSEPLMKGLAEAAAFAKVQDMTIVIT
jgi:hypothetical protein